MSAVSGQRSELPILSGTISTPKSGSKTLTLFDVNNEKIITGEVVGLKDRLIVKSKKVTYFDSVLGQNKTVHVKVNTLVSDKFNTSGKGALKSLKEFENGAQTHLAIPKEILEIGKMAADRRKKEAPPVSDLSEAQTQADVNAWIKQRLASPAPIQPQAPTTPKQAPAPGLSNARTHADVNAWIRQKVAATNSSQSTSSESVQQKATGSDNQAIEKKLDQLKDIKINIPRSEYKKVGFEFEKVREHTLLTDTLKKELITHIEDHKEEWLKEAADKKQWIVKKVSLNDGTTVKVEIFPPDRKNADKLGLIDIRMEFVNSGSSKKVYKSLNYDVGKVRAGVYGKTEDIQGDLRSEKRLNKRLNELNARAEKKADGTSDKVKKKIVLSKAHDEHIKETKAGQKVEKSKLTQSLLEPVNLSKVLETRRLPNGKLLDEQTQIKLLVSAFESLEQMHAMGMVHADLKSDNIVLKQRINPVTKEIEYEVRVIDYGLSEKKNTTTDVRGTPGYVAPEILKESAEKGTGTYTVASDLYAMGVAFSDPAKADPWWPEILYDIDVVSSSPPFLAASQGLPYKRLGEGLYSSEFQAGLNKLTSFDPKDRFQSAREARDYFQGLLK